MKTMQRAVQLKKIVPIDGDRYPAIQPLNMHLAMKEVFEKAGTVGSRHHPERLKVSAGKRCVFFEPVAKVGVSVLFHAYIYVAGRTPDQVVQDFDAPAAAISADPILTEDGDVVELVERVACLVYGEAFVIENARVYGSAPIVLAAMRELIRRHVNPKFPNLRLEDAPNRGFKKLAKVHGGVKKVVARLNKDFTPEPESFGQALETLFTDTNVGPFKQVSATVEADSGKQLDPDEVLRLIDESEGSTGLSGISVTFNSGTTLSDLDDYRERHILDVQEIRPGVPAVNEIETGMVQYLRSLAQADDEDARVIDKQGKFIPSK